MTTIELVVTDDNLGVITHKVELPENSVNMIMDYFNHVYGTDEEGNQRIPQDVIKEVMKGIVRGYQDGATRFAKDKARKIAEEAITPIEVNEIT